jgi:hypothetical protein
MNIKQYIKKLLRQNFYVECLSYLIQNNILRKINFIGSGEWEPTFEIIYDRFTRIAKSYLDFIKNEKVEINKETLIIEIGVGFSTAACYELSKNKDCFHVVAYDAFMALKKNIDTSIQAKYYSEIKNVSYIIGLDKLNSFLNENKNKFKKIVIFSTTVLQHVWDVKGLINVIDKYSKVTSIHLHSIDLMNLNKFSKYGPLYFLKFSDFFWGLMAKNVGHQNRWRYNHYLNYFNEIGYKVDLLEYEKYSDEEVQKARQTYLKNREIATNETLEYATVTIKCVKTKTDSN